MSNLVLPSGPKIWNPRMPGGLLDELVWYVSGENSAYSHVHDGSGHERHGTVSQGSPYWTEVHGRPSIWLKDNGSGSTNDAVDMPSTVPVPEGGASTFLYRVSSLRIANDRRFAWRWPDGQRVCRFENATSEVQFYWRDRSTHGFTDNFAYTAGDLRFFGVVSDWNANAAWWVIDGSLSAATMSGAGFRSGEWPAATLQFGMGSHTNYYGLNGVVCEPMLWHRKLSAPEIEWLANPANHLRVPWRRKSWLVGGAVTVSAAEASITQTLGALSQQAAGAVQVQASAVQSLGGLEQAAAGSVGRQATIAQTLGTLSQLAAGAVQVDAAATQTLGALSQQAAGTVHVQASAVQTLGALSQAVAAGVQVQATAAQTLGGIEQAAAGTTGDAVGAAITQTLGALSQQAAGSVGRQASAISTLGALSQQLDVVVPASAEIASTLGALSQALDAESPMTLRADTLRLYETAAMETEVNSLAPIGTLAGVVVRHAAGLCGPGLGWVKYSGGKLSFKAPGSDTYGLGFPVSMLPTPTTPIVLRDGENLDQLVRVQVYADYLPDPPAEASVYFHDRYNNHIGQPNCAAADAEAGEVLEYEITCYNAGSLAGTSSDITALTFWATQAAESTIEISDDGISWVSPTTEGTGLVLGTVAHEATATLYVRRTIAPASEAAPNVLTLLHGSFLYRGDLYCLDARGRFRVLNAAGYNLHWTTAPADPPDEEDAADTFAASLPETPDDVFGDGTHYFAASAYNGVLDSGFAPVGPLGETYLSLTISGGAEAAEPPATPTDVTLTAEAGGVVRVEAAYVETTDANRADEWAIAYTITGVDPDADDPDITATLDSSPYAVLSYALPAQAHAAEVRVRVQVRRNDGTEESPVWVYSASEVVTLAADAEGPSEVLGLVASC